MSNMGSNLRAGLTQPELFWSICLENSCCCVHTCYPSSSLCTVPRATVPPGPHWDGPCRFLRCLTRRQLNWLTACSAPLPAQPSSTYKRPFQVTLYQTFTLGIFSFPSSQPCVIRGHKNFDKNLTESLRSSVKTRTAKSKSQWPD